MAPQVFFEICYFQICGGASWIRTSDTRIFSPLLYQLSYGTLRIFFESVTFRFGGSSWILTSDTVIFILLLYHLSFGTLRIFLDSVTFIFGGASWIRTSDTRIFSPLLYQLSYGTCCNSFFLLLRCKSRFFF